MVRNLRAAKHRFESTTKPLGRFCLHLPAIIEVAHSIACARSCSQEGRSMAQWLQSISSVDLLLLAMLADAHDEGLMLVRCFDNSQVDLADLANNLSTFTDHLRCLFDQAMCWTVEGYTSHVLQLLASHTIAIPAVGVGITRIMPPATEADKDHALTKMKVWMQLAVSVLEAEFPSFSLVRAFAILDLGIEKPAMTLASDNLANINRQENDIARLAQAFKLDASLLRAELSHMRPRAQAVKQQIGCSTQEAWRKVTQKASSRR